MTNTMKEFTAAKMLTAAIKKVMGERYDNDRTVVANVTSLMRGEKELKSGFQSHKEDTMPRLPKNNAPKTPKKTEVPKAQKVAQAPKKKPAEKKQKVAKVTAKKKKKTA